MGNHFQDLGAPFSDHLCVAGGDVFDHPSASPTASQPPTVVPTPTPMLPAPTPIPAPSGVPLPMPTLSTPVFARLGITLTLSTVIACDAYGSEEEAVVNDALASVVTEVAPAFDDHVCTDVSRRARRALRDESVSISVSTNVIVDTAELDDDDVLGSLSTSILAAQSTGALVSQLNAAAAAVSNGPLGAATVSDVSLASQSPSMVPTVTLPPSAPLVCSAAPTFSERACNYTGGVCYSSMATCLSLGVWHSEGCGIVGSCDCCVIGQPSSSPSSAPSSSPSPAPTSPPSQPPSTNPANASTTAPPPRANGPANCLVPYDHVP